MKYLKSYKLFEEKTYEFGCVMIDVPVKNWNEITSFINTDDIYTVSDNDTYGLQVRPHLTLLYGTHKEVTSDQVSDIIKDVMFDWRNKPIEIEINGIDIFENENFDVVKFNVVKNDILQNLFDELSKLPNSNKFFDYRPHITICYTKKGMGKKYIRKYSHKLSSNKICYSMTNGDKIYFKI